MFVPKIAAPDPMQYHQKREERRKRKVWNMPKHKIWLRVFHVFSFSFFFFSGQEMGNCNLNYLTGTGTGTSDSTLAVFLQRYSNTNFWPACADDGTVLLISANARNVFHPLNFNFWPKRKMCVRCVFRNGQSAENNLLKDKCWQTSFWLNEWQLLTLLNIIKLYFTFKFFSFDLLWTVPHTVRMSFLFAVNAMYDSSFAY